MQKLMAGILIKKKALTLNRVRAFLKLTRTQCSSIQPLILIDRRYAHRSSL